MIGPAEIFTILFVTLGPLKMIGPFAQRTHGLDDAIVRKIAVRAFLIATAAAVVGGFIGSALLAKWHVSVGSMLIAAGVIFLLVALRQLIEQYEPPRAPDTMAPALPSTPTAAALKLLFPIVLTPYGIATVIVLLSASIDTTRTEIILALIFGVMIINLVAMLFARRILVGPAIIVLQILGGVLGIMQAGLAVEFIVRGLRELKIVGG